MVTHPTAFTTTRVVSGRQPSQSSTVLVSPWKRLAGNSFQPASPPPETRRPVVAARWPADCTTLGGGVALPDPDPLAVGLLAVRIELRALRIELARQGHGDVAAAIAKVDGCVGLLAHQVEVARVERAAHATQLAELRAEVAELRRRQG